MYWCCRASNSPVTLLKETTNRPRYVNRENGIGFNCCSLLEILLSCLAFHGNCYLATILPTALQLVIRKAELQAEWRNLRVFEAFERNRCTGTRLETFYCNNSSDCNILISSNRDKRLSPRQTRTGTGTNGSNNWVLMTMHLRLRT